MDAVVPPNLWSMFHEASRVTGVPVEVLAKIARQESAYNPAAVGRAGEVGVFQILPSTARQPGFGVQPADPAALRDPRANVMFGAQYLAGRARAAGVTDWADPAQRSRALLAYNGGGDPNYVANVERWRPRLDGSPVEPGSVAAAPPAPAAPSPAPAPAVTPPQAPAQAAPPFAASMAPPLSSFGDLFATPVTSSPGWTKGRGRDRRQMLFG
jgi:hypothetical protein